MDKFSRLLSDQFGATLAENFQKQASYYRAMDSLEYLAEDTTTVAERVDSFLTVLVTADDRRLVGFRLKGFRYVFNRFVQPAMKLKSDDFDPIIWVLQRIFTDAGNTVTAAGEADALRREQAYRQAADLARRDQVALPPDFPVAA